MKVAQSFLALAMFATVGCGKAPERLSFQSHPESVRTCGYVDALLQQKQMSGEDSASLLNRELKLVSATVVSSQKTGQNSYQEIAGSVKVGADAESSQAEVLCSTSKSKSVSLNNDVEITVPSTLVVKGDLITESEASQVAVTQAAFSRSSSEAADEPVLTLETGAGYKTLEGWVRSKKDAKIRYYQPTPSTLIVRFVTKSPLAYKIEIYEFEILPESKTTPADEVAPQPTAADAQSGTAV